MMASTFLDDLRKSWQEMGELRYSLAAESGLEDSRALTSWVGSPVNPNQSFVPDELLTQMATYFATQSMGYARTHPTGGQNPPLDTESEEAEAYRERLRQLGYPEDAVQAMSQIGGTTPTAMAGQRPPTFELGDLANMYQTVPAMRISEGIHKYTEAGKPAHAEALKIIYGNVFRSPEPGTNQPDVDYPLRENNWEALTTNLPSFATGQRDTKMQPGLVAMLLQQRAGGKEGATTRRYKGGTKITGLLGTAQLGKKTLGG